MSGQAGLISIEQSAILLACPELPCLEAAVKDADPPMELTIGRERTLLDQVGMSQLLGGLSRLAEGTSRGKQAIDRRARQPQSAEVKAAANDVHYLVLPGPSLHTVLTSLWPLSSTGDATRNFASHEVEAEAKSMPVTQCFAFSEVFQPRHCDIRKP